MAASRSALEQAGARRRQRIDEYAESLAIFDQWFMAYDDGRPVSMVALAAELGRPLHDVEKAIFDGADLLRRRLACTKVLIPKHKINTYNAWCRELVSDNA